MFMLFIIPLLPYMFAFVRVFVEMVGVEKISVDCFLISGGFGDRYLLTTCRLSSVDSRRHRRLSSPSPTYDLLKKQKSSLLRSAD